MARSLGPAAFFAALAVSLLLYAPVLTAPVVYDDAAHVRDHPVFRLPFDRFCAELASPRYFASAGERTYQPLVTLLHYFTHGRPPLYRAIGLAAHLASALLVFAVGLRLTGRRRSAAFAALLFAVFPTHTETLNFSSFKGHVFGAMFSMAGLACLMAWDESKGRGRGVLAAMTAFYVLALLSKETGLVFAALAAAYLLLSGRKAPERFAAPALGLAAATLLYLGLRFWLLDQPAAFPVRFHHPALSSFAWYLKTLAVPYPVCLEHTLTPGRADVVWAAAFAGAFWAWRRSAARMFCLLWIALALAPVLHFIPFSNVSPVADRYLYLPAAGFCLLLSGLAERRSGRALLCGVIAVWGGLTLARNLTYRSGRALFEQTAACAPANPRAQFLLGMTCLQERDYRASREAFERVLALTDSPGAHTALGDISLAEGDAEEARRRYSRARRLQSDWDQVYPNARAFLEAGASTRREGSAPARGSP